MSQVIGQRRAAPAGVAMVLIVLGLGAAASCGSAPPSPVDAYDPPAKPSSTRAPKARGKAQHGKATWYGGRFQGRKTASGERFDKRDFTAAHRTLPFGTRVRVTREGTDKSVEVRINDRGPFGGGGRIIDLSEAAAEELDMIRAGVVRVRVEVVAEP